MKSTNLQIIGVFGVFAVLLLAYMLPSLGISRWWIGGPIALFFFVTLTAAFISHV